MTWVWLPWRRWREAEERADQAEASLARVVDDHARAQRLAAEARRLRGTNGFTEAIRHAMGVTR